MKRLIVLMIFISLIFTGCGQPSMNKIEGDKESKNEISIVFQDNRIRVITDEITGCQYIGYDYNGTAITPRMGKDGKQICE